MNIVNVEGVVVRGLGVASGKRFDFAVDGTIQRQIEPFLERGLDLRGYYPGTLNVDIAPWNFEIQQPLITFRNVSWHPTGPTENFSFVPCTLIHKECVIAALVYYPRPETKAAYAPMPPANILEILAPRISEINYGSRITLSLDSVRMRLWHQHL